MYVVWMVTHINSSLFPRECENICHTKWFLNQSYKLVELIFFKLTIYPKGESMQL
jgi:hypothetical protein